MDDLILPGTIPGLLRRGSPVVFAADEHIGSHIFYVGCRAVVDDVIGADPVVRGKHIFPAAVALDLTDATGRAHAGWWWRATLYPDLPWRSNPEWGGCYSFNGFWNFMGDGRYHAALADLDPNDPRLLPDGSRWVDAEALRRVVLHVAGVPGA